MLFMPTFTSGPIDRFKRFNDDYQAIPERDELMNMLEQAVKYIMLGFLYKFVLAQIFGSMLLPPLKTQALAKAVSLIYQRLVSCMFTVLISL